MQKKIIVLMVSIRPKVAEVTLDHWTRTARDPFEVHLILNEPFESKYDVSVVKSERPGIVDSLYQFTKNFSPDPNSIIIVTNDDMFATEGWDEFIQIQYQDFDGLLVVFDGHNPYAVATVPILSYGLFMDLGKAIFHPSYYHLYPDNELYDIAGAMNRLKDIRARGDMTVWFEHRHYNAGKRTKDEFDVRSNSNANWDGENYHRRHSLPVHEKLKI